MAKTEILLESGTNEMEIMKFTINDGLYGINVAKVREIMVAGKAQSVPHSHNAVEGIFKPRETIFTVVDLPYYLTGEKAEHEEKDLFVITNFNRINIAFRVHTVVGIQRLSWEDIEKPDSTISRGEEGIATGIAQIDDELIIILDFEKIVADISPETGIQAMSKQSFQNRTERGESILIAEDSMLLTRLIVDTLTKAGYTNVKQFNNGYELWSYINKIKDFDNFSDLVRLIITDIEMPQMDGHKLTKLIKDTKEFRHIPVIIFSSLINMEMEIKGKELGANAQLSKPQIEKLIATMDELLTPED